MNRASRSRSAVDDDGKTAREAGSLGRRGLGLATGSATAIFVSLASGASAQVIPSTTDIVAAPWNAQKVFEPSGLLDLTPVDSRDEIAPEDTPVKNRQQPGYEPVGIRYGSWMFNPSLMSGALYDSNVFSSNADKRSDIAAVIAPSLRAHTLWERHGIDIKLDSASTIYRENSSLDQTNASLKGNAWYDISHDLAVLTNFQIAHLNEGVGTLSSPANAVTPTPYELYSGDISVRKEFNRLAASVGVSVASYDYGSARAQDGSIINQDGRDGQIYTLHGR
ncbi:MAG: outer membrane beta-barrel protein, partial [Steroidobacteraceae bacterium]